MREMRENHIGKKIVLAILCSETGLKSQEIFKLFLVVVEVSIFPS